MEERTGPLTWGQYLPWVTHYAAPESDTYFKIQTFDITEPADTSVDEMLDVVDRIVAKNEGLRTTFERVAGAHRQIVHPMRKRGYRHVVHDPTNPAYAEPPNGDVDWIVQPYDLAGEWPIRVAIWRFGDGRLNLRVAVHRLILDREGMFFFRGHFWRGMHPGSTERVEVEVDDDAETWNPIDIAEFEQSAAGQRRDERAYRYWHRILTAAPASLFTTSRPPEPTDSRYIIKMGRDGMRPLVRELATAMRVTEPSVLLAIALLVLSWTGRWPAVAASLIANNRSLRPMRSSMSPMLDSSLVNAVVDPTQPFSAWVRTVAALSLGAYKHSHADPVTMLRAQAEVSMERGVLLDRLPIINVMADPEPAAHDGRGEPEPLEDEYTVNVVASPLDGSYIRARLWWRRVTVELICGEQMCEQATAERIVHLFPATLDALTAHGDLTVGELAEMVLGMVPDTAGESSRSAAAQGVAWAEIDHTRVDLAAVEALLRECPGVTGCAVAVDTGADGTPRLHAHVAGDERVHDLATLRLAVLGRLPYHRHVLCPHRFRVVREMPSQPDEAGWTALPAVAEGSGWPAPPLRASSETEQALAESVATALPPRTADSIDLGLPFTLVGGRFESVPDVLDALAERGIKGINVDDLFGTVPLVKLLR